MSDLIDSKPGTLYYVIVGVFLTWNLIGMMLYYQQMTLTPEIMVSAGMSDAEMAWVEATPTWANAAYAIAVTLGVLASILMLLRRKEAVPAYMVSLAAIIVQDFESFVLRNPIETWGTNAYYVPTAVLIIAIVEIWYSRSSKAKGWLS